MRDIITNPLLYKIIISFIIIVAAVVILLLLKKVYNRYMSERPGSEQSKMKKGSIPSVFYGIVRILIMIVAITWVLQINGIDVGSIVTGLGVVGIIVGFALQDILKDVIMGLHILSDHFFDIGDVIKYNGTEGVVTDFNLRTTKIRSTVDGSSTVVSNRNISEVVRCSLLTDIDVPLSYDDSLQDVDAAMGAACERIAELPHVEKCVFKGTQEFQDSCIRYKVRFFVNPIYRFDTRRAANRIIQEELAKAGMSIPFNQLDVHLDKPLS